MNFLAAYFNSDFRESTKHILHQIKNLEMDIDRDVRDCAGNVEPPSPPAVTQDDDREEDQQNDSGGEYASPLVASMSSLCLDSASPNDEVFTEAPEEELN